MPNQRRPCLHLSWESDIVLRVTVPGIAARARGAYLHALLALFLIACLAFAGCGSKRVSANQQHEKAISSEIGLPAKVDCSGSVCSIVARQRFISHKEAWFVALPPVFVVWSDPALEQVRSVSFRLMFERRNRAAVFHCSLRRKKAPAYATVENIREICTSRFGPAY